MSVNPILAGFVGTGLITWAVTGQGEWAIGVASVDFGFKIGLYIVHERIWNQITWGKA